MSVHSTKRQPRRKSGGGKKPTPYRFKDGDLVEVELQRPRNEASQRQRATLDSLGLGRRGQIQIIPFRESTVGGMFLHVGHFINVRPARPNKAATSKVRRKAKAPRRRRRESRSSAVTEQTYKSGGGESRLIEVPGAGLLRIEAQRESFALMWPSQLTAAAFFDAARSVWWSKYGNVSLMSFEKSEVAELPVADLSVWLKKEEAILFARIDFQDRALTWAAQYKDPERSGLKVNPEVQQAREVSLSGLKFDPDHASRLLVATALKPMAELVDELMASATETLSAYA